MELYEFTDYKKFVRGWVEAKPRNGYGQYRKLAASLNTTSTVISQVFKGDRDLTLEQALEATNFFQMNDLERDYFILLVQFGRAGSHGLKKQFLGQIHRTQKMAMNLKKRLPHRDHLTSEDLSTFHSHWLFAAVHLTATTAQLSIEEIAKRLRSPRNKVKDVVDFLVSRGLCEEDNGIITAKDFRTHLDKGSLLVGTHHSNWRQKARERYDELDDSQELCFSFPVSLSYEDVKTIRKEIIRFIEQIDNRIVNSKSECCACLNIDWVRF